ncbi:hypothetical protein TALC_01111 [Thermoplasmatales archaeon BRNA1]|nr:hypothetical protein TALC_01111 [Thermoplasmatales archaeon BRNA1]
MNPQELESELQSLADEQYRIFNSRISASPKRSIGVKMPLLRGIARRINREDWRTFVQYPSESLEHCVVKGLVIATAKCSGDERLALTEDFIGEIEEWNTCDTFCSAWKIDSGETSDRLFSRCESLLETGKEFPMRVGAVMMLSKFIDGEHIGRVLKDLGEPRESPGYYWDIGCAWALSVCYVKFPKETEPVLLSGRIPPAILRMSLQKIRDSFRVEKADKERITKCARLL